MKTNKELSYKEACQELNDHELKSGRNRDLQLNRWNKLAEVEKVGRGKYIIKRQFTQEEIQEKEYSRNYSKFLQNMLINMFAKQSSNKQTYTYRQLREYLNMVNMHYFPVKYGNESIKIEAPCEINLSDVFNEEDETDRFALASQEKFWFKQADDHDRDALHYALAVLMNRGLLADYRFTYVFYQVNKDNEGRTVYTRPVVADDDQYAEIHQRIMEFLKSKLTEEQILAIEKKVELENSEDKNNRIFNLYKKVVLAQGEKVRGEYGDIPRKYAVEIGYSGYAKAITILKPTRLENLVDAFAPKFNSVQVEEFLKSKRFNKPKELTESIHYQLTDKLIKI